MGASLNKIEYKDITFHRKLGAGGFGVVHHVTFKKSLRGRKEGVAKTVFDSVLENEVNIMAELCHPNIVTLFGVCQTGAVNIILLEYARYGSLHDYLSDLSKPVTPDLRKKWMKESALALQYLHAHNFLHRDIKPSNCLLFEDYVLKLCDFGLAKQITKSQTTSGYKGTCQYIAPEIHRGNKNGRAVYSKPSDIYAYGMMLLEMYTRRQPFDGLEWYAVVFHVGCGNQLDIPGDCPTELADLMRRCWREEPKGRPPIDDIVEELFEWHLVETITPSVDGDGGLFLVQQVACCPNGDIVAVENGIATSTYPFSQICIMNRAREEIAHRQFQKRTNTIAISKEGHIVQVCKRLVTILDKNLNHVREFSVPSYDENRIYRVICARVGYSDRIVLYDQGQTVWVHSFSTGKLIKYFKMMRRIRTHASQTMALNTNNQILFHVRPDGETYSEVIAIDYTGKEVFSFKPTIDEDLQHRWVWAQGIVCDQYNNIYVGLRVMGADHTGHIHKYSPEGKFIGCIVRGLYMIKKLDIATDGSLVVADWKTVRIYEVQ